MRRFVSVGQNIRRRQHNGYLKSMASCCWSFRNDLKEKWIDAKMIGTCKHSALPTFSRFAKHLLSNFTLNCPKRRELRFMAADIKKPSGYYFAGRLLRRPKSVIWLVHVFRAQAAAQVNSLVLGMLQTMGCCPTYAHTTMSQLAFQVFVHGKKTMGQRETSRVSLTNLNKHYRRV